MNSDKSKEIKPEQKRAIINQVFIKRFSMLKHMYENALEEDRLEREWQNYLDWKSWDELDDEAKDSLRQCLKEGSKE